MNLIITFVHNLDTFTIPITREEGSTLLELCGDLASPVTVQSYSHQLEVDLGHQDDHQNTFKIVKMITILSLIIKIIAKLSHIISPY